MAYLREIVVVRVVVVGVVCSSGSGGSRGVGSMRGYGWITWMSWFHITWIHYPKQMSIRISNRLDTLCLFLKHGTHINVRIPNYLIKSSNRNTLEGQIGKLNFTRTSLQNICVLLLKVVRAPLRPERKRRRERFLEYLCRKKIVPKRKAAGKRW